MTKKTEQMDSNSAYGPTNHSEDVVTTMCNIVEGSGPQPMKGMKKTNKVPNAAEQFSADHHGEYEARARQSSDKVERVKRHNQAYPKMCDELDKRASASNVVAVTMSRKDAMKLTGSNSHRNRKVTKHQTRTSRKRISRPQKPRTIRKRVTKRKANNRSYRLSRIWKSRGCQCYPPKRSEISSNVKDNGTDVMLWARSSFKRTSRLSQCSNGTDKFPGTSEPTASSYHSFSSMEQEPMVS